VTLVVGASALSRADACDLQPADRNPKDIGIPMSPAARAVNDTFTFGPASERFYDHVETLDGITLGFGHWPQEEVEGLFKDMSPPMAARRSRLSPDAPRQPARGLGNSLRFVIE
jgi:hypothetical protein